VDSSKPSSERDFRRVGCSLPWEEGEERGLEFCVIQKAPRGRAFWLEGVSGEAGIPPEHDCTPHDLSGMLARPQDDELFSLSRSECP